MGGITEEIEFGRTRAAVEKLFCNHRDNPPELEDLDGMLYWRCTTCGIKVGPVWCSRRGCNSPATIYSQGMKNLECDAHGRDGGGFGII